MSEIKLSKDDKARIVLKIKDYFDRELDQEIGGFDAEFLLDFFAKEIGGYFYNQGLYDAQGFMNERLEQLTEAMYELEKEV